MTKDEWLKKAKKLEDACDDACSSKRGSIKCSTSEAKTANALGHEIGSHHGINPVVYKDLGASLKKMIGLVEHGTKDSCFKTVK